MVLIKGTPPSESGCQACGVLLAENGEAQSLGYVCPFGMCVEWLGGGVFRIRIHLAVVCVLTAVLGVQEVTGSWLVPEQFASIKRLLAIAWLI